MLYSQTGLYQNLATVSRSSLSGYRRKESGSVQFPQKKKGKFENFREPHHGIGHYVRFDGTQRGFETACHPIFTSIFFSFLVSLLAGEIHTRYIIAPCSRPRSDGRITAREPSVVPKCQLSRISPHFARALRSLCFVCFWSVSTGRILAFARRGRPIFDYIFKVFGTARTKKTNGSWGRNYAMRKLRDTRT